MAARPQWYFSSIGLMNSVQPYCRLAIITMQTMPRASWPHRVHTEVTAGTLADVVMMLIPDRVWRCNIISTGARSLLHPDGSRLRALNCEVMPLDGGCGLPLERLPCHDGRVILGEALPCRLQDPIRRSNPRFPVGSSR